MPSAALSRCRGTAASVLKQCLQSVMALAPLAPNQALVAILACTKHGWKQLATTAAHGPSAMMQLPMTQTLVKVPVFRRICFHACSQ